MEKNKLIYIGIFVLLMLSFLTGLIRIFRPIKKENITEKGRTFLKEKSIAVINLYGVIKFSSSSNPVSTFYSYDRFVRRLRNLSRNANVAGIVLRVNSPGGSIGASQEIYEEIINLKKKGKIVYVSFGDVAASGAYYVSAPADRIYANPGTITGSIGAIFELGNLTELAKKIGVKFEVVKSGKYKDIGNMFRDTSKEEKKLLQEIIDRTYNQFVTVVSTGRKIPVEKVREFADGRIMDGETALELGLIDQFGNLQDTIEDLWKKVGGTGEPNILREKPSIENMFDYLSFSEESILNLNGLFRGKWNY